MYSRNLLALAGLYALTSAAPNPVPQSVASIQANIQAAQGVILTIINDLAQQRSAVADFSALQAGLAPLVTFTCPPAAPLAAATSSNQAIQYLQEVQLELNIVSLAIQDADSAGAQNGVCTALGYFTAAGAFITPSGQPTPTSPTPTSPSTTSPTPTPTDCISQETSCRTAPNANQSFCSAQAASCQATCSTNFNACSTAPNANHAYCASQYAACLGYNPFTTASTTLMTSTSSAPFVCNLAHSYPTPLTCIQTNGSIALVTNTLLPH
ncbi:hypothetical protein LTR86_010347 [Recurvomyces mirabilis]|nr:hypothetical protein LTR86_010347 [Recurvomyces mirabilis]